MITVNFSDGTYITATDQADLEKKLKGLPGIAVYIPGIAVFEKGKILDVKVT